MLTRAQDEDQGDDWLAPNPNRARADEDEVEEEESDAED